METLQIGKCGVCQAHCKEKGKNRRPTGSIDKMYAASFFKNRKMAEGRLELCNEIFWAMHFFQVLTVDQGDVVVWNFFSVGYEDWLSVDNFTDAMISSVL